MLIASIVPTEKALKNTFNDDGTRKWKIRLKDKNLEPFVVYTILNCFKLFKIIAEVPLR